MRVEVRAACALRKPAKSASAAEDDERDRHRQRRLVRRRALERLAGLVVRACVVAVAVRVLRRPCQLRDDRPAAELAVEGQEVRAANM